MKKIFLISFVALSMIFAVSCDEAGKSEEEKGKEQGKEQKEGTEEVKTDITGVYNFTERSDGKDMVEYHKIEIKEDGSYFESYQPKGDTYVGENTGTWELKDNTLTLVSEGITLTYAVDGNTITRTTEGGVSFTFVK